MQPTPNISGIIREIRETLGFLVTTRASFRKDLVMYATILYLFFSKQAEISEYRREKEISVAREMTKDMETKKAYNTLMLLWKQDVIYFSRVFREVQRESSKINLETEKLNLKDKE